MGNSAICTPSINKNKRSEFLTTRKLYEALNSSSTRIL